MFADKDYLGFEEESCPKLDKVIEGHRFAEDGDTPIDKEA